MKTLSALALLIAVSSHAGTVTRREFVKDGVTYVEETNIGNNGNVSRNLYPKPGQDADRLEAEAKALAAEPKAVPRSRREARRNGSITRGQAVQLNQAIGACKPLSFQAAHPMQPEFMIEYQVHGAQGGKCRFTQTMPGGEIQTCHFSEAQRGDIKKNGVTALQKWMGDPKVCPISKK